MAPLISKIVPASLARWRTEGSSGAKLIELRNLIGRQDCAEICVGLRAVRGQRGAQGLRDAIDRRGLLVGQRQRLRQAGRQRRVRRAMATLIRRCGRRINRIEHGQLVGRQRAANLIARGADQCLTIGAKLTKDRIGLRLLLIGELQRIGPRSARAMIG